MCLSFLHIDGEILLWIQEHVRTEAFNPIVTAITHLGDKGLLWITLTILLLIVSKTRNTGTVCACSLIVSFVINNLILKNVVARTRPYEVVQGLHRIIEAQKDLSFPSGHSASSFAVAVVMFVMLPKKYGIPALIMAFAIALSRLYVGVHYPTDVLGGMLSGTVIALLSYWVITKKILKKENN